MRTTVTILLLLSLLPFSRTQTVWPGDVNNNGMVNNIDILYWGVAREAAGPARQDATTDWNGQAITSPWGLTFPNGVNYAFADCDGDGIVTDNDKAVIEDNYGLVHDALTPDEFVQGDPDLDPVLLLSSDMEDLSPGEVWKVRLSLGSEEDTIQNFYGIAFTITYNPDVIGNQASNFRLEIDEDSWLYGIGPNQVVQFVHNDPVNGVANITVTRTNQQEISGFGEIGEFSIVIEDIIIGFSTANLQISDVKLVGLDLTETPVASSGLQASILTSFTGSPEKHKAFKVYPNPVKDNLFIELENLSDKIQQVQLFNAMGQQVLNQTFRHGEERQSIEMGRFPAGIYLLKIQTEHFTYVQKISR